MRAFGRGGMRDSEGSKAVTMKRGAGPERPAAAKAAGRVAVFGGRGLEAMEKEILLLGAIRER